MRIRRWTSNCQTTTACSDQLSVSSPSRRSPPWPRSSTESTAFPYEIVRRLAELDLMGIPFPAQYGGAGGDSLAYALVVEELARVDSSVAITLCAHTSLGTQPIYLFGSEEQKQEWLPRLCSGEILGAFGLTEPEAGLGRRQHPDPGGARGRPLGHQRGQAVHHQRRDRHLRRGGDHGRHGPDRGGRWRAGPGDLQPARAQRHARVRARPAVPEDGLERLRHPAADVQPTAGCRPRTWSASAEPGCASS